MVDIVNIVDVAGVVSSNFKPLPPTPPIPNLYVNPLFIGGGINTAPNNHTFLFATSDLNASNEQILTNTNNVDGRCVIGYQINTNNPGLTIGQEYRISYLCQNLSNTNYSVALTTSNQNEVNIIEQVGSILALETKLLYVRFTVLSASFTLQIRIGTGTTTNNTVQLRYYNPRLTTI